MDGVSKETAFFVARYDAAATEWKEGHRINADEICRFLVTHFACPPFLQVQAWQLRSLCSGQYYNARSHLESSFVILDKYPRADPVVAGLYTLTEARIAALDGNWEAKWKNLGLKPPTKEEEEVKQERECERWFSETSEDDEATRAVDAAAEAISGMMLGEEDDKMDEDDKREKDGKGVATSVSALVCTQAPPADADPLGANQRRHGGTRTKSGQIE
ncbi:hypothetical protein LTR08_001817 [Meristemomyces frigidus]|nr:hypothetical protein LTR08_001817 [Meristemomyces frigidus]